MEKTQEKTPATVQRETQSKIDKIKRRLAEMREYKKILAQDDLEPDVEDKRIESELIIKLLRLERQLNGGQNPKRKPHRPKKKNAGAKKPAPRSTKRK